jgi:hypothetical protein
MVKLGKLTPIRRMPHTICGHQVWEFRCDCGELVERRLGLVRDTIAAGYVAACRACRSVRGDCGSTRKSKHCVRCEGMPHRRPVLGHCKCGQRYVPEQMFPPIWHQAVARRER